MKTHSVRVLRLNRVGARVTVWEAELRDGTPALVKRFDDAARCRRELRALEALQDSGACAGRFAPLTGGYGRAVEDHEVAWPGAARHLWASHERLRDAHPRSAPAGHGPGHGPAGPMSAHPRILVTSRLPEPCDAPFNGEGQRSREGGPSRTDRSAEEGMPTDSDLLERMRGTFQLVGEMHEIAGMSHGDVRPGSFGAGGMPTLLDLDCSARIGATTGGDTEAAHADWRGSRESRMHAAPELLARGAWLTALGSGVRWGRGVSGERGSLATDGGAAADAWALGVMLFCAAHRGRVEHPFVYHHRDLETMTAESFASAVCGSEYSAEMWANRGAPLAADLVSVLLARRPEWRPRIPRALEEHPFFGARDGARARCVWLRT